MGQIFFTGGFFKNFCEPALADGEDGKKIRQRPLGARCEGYPVKT
jgi:hypothetical protein